MPITSTPVRLDRAFDDPASIRDLIERRGPYRPLALEAQSDAERRASGAQAGGSFVPPWFRRNFAVAGEPLVDGADVILQNPAFVDAAREVFGGAGVVEPTTVYVNVMGPCPYPFVAHIDVPVFRGASRANTPVWLLHQMLASRLFEADRFKLATAVSWFFDGPGGDFHYWPDGPDGDGRVETAPFANVAIVADNEVTYHGVGPLGVTDAPSPIDLTIDASIDRTADDRWTIVDGETTPASYADDDVRITISWKAEVFADEAERDRMRSTDGALDLDTVVARFMDDLRSRGVDAADPSDPLDDDTWTRTLADTYQERAPRIG